MMDEQEVSEICQTCKFWHAHDWQRKFSLGANVSESECRFNAPVVRLDAEGFRDTVWPRTRGLEFCGQWQQCEEEK